MLTPQWGWYEGRRSPLCCSCLRVLPPPQYVHRAVIYLYTRRYTRGAGWFVCWGAHLSLLQDLSPLSGTYRTAEDKVGHMWARVLCVFFSAAVFSVVAIRFLMSGPIYMLFPRRSD